MPRNALWLLFAPVMALSMSEDPLLFPKDETSKRRRP